MKFFFHKDERASEELFTRIAEACRGLVYVSEIDAEVTPYTSPIRGMDALEIILQHNGRQAEDAVDEMRSGELFGRLTALREWFGERERVRAKKFLELQKLLEENLDPLKVYRLGKIRIDIFIVGFDKAGRLMGVKTGAVET